MKKAHISLPTIHCESCTKLIGMTLKTIPGIRKQDFSIENRTLDIEFDHSTSGQAIVSAIVEDAGYEAKLESEEESESTPHPSPLLEGEGVRGIISPIPPTPESRGGDNSPPSPPKGEGVRG